MKYYRTRVAMSTPSVVHEKSESSQERDSSRRRRGTFSIEEQDRHHARTMERWSTRRPCRVFTRLARSAARNSVALALVLLVNGAVMCPCMGAVHQFVVYRNHSVPISAADVRQILATAQELLCEACAAARGLDNPACRIKLQLAQPPHDKDVPVEPMRALVGGFPSEEQMDTEIYRWNPRGKQDFVDLPRVGPMFPPKQHEIHLVLGIGKCGADSARPKTGDARTKHDGDIVGCSVAFYRRSFIRLYPPRPQRNDSLSDWYRRQAMIWAHELGHRIGMDYDLDRPGEQGRLMFCTGAAWPKSLNDRKRLLTPLECDSFDSNKPTGRLPPPL